MRVATFVIALAIAQWSAAVPAAAAVSRRLARSLSRPRHTSVNVAGRDARRLRAGRPLSTETVVDQGIRVEFDARLEEPATFSFRLTDTTTNAPVTGVRPAAWLALHDGPKDCTRRAATYLAGDLFARADVDLTSYFVLTLNDDASISVVDPLFGFGGSRLLAMLTLPARGEDWALTQDHQTLFVSMPDAGGVAVADTRTWNLRRTIATGPHPRRVVMQPDGSRLWVADDEGLTSIETGSLVATRVRCGKTRDLAISNDSRFVFAATGQTVAVIDAQSRRAIARVSVDGEPSSLAWSSAAKLVYAADRTSGSIFAIDPQKRGVVATVAARPGIAQIRFAPNGRHALIANPEQNFIQVIDAATNRIVQNAEISEGPDQITFTDLLAYVRRRSSETILMISLDQLGREGKPINVADFPGGQHAYGEGPASLADSIVPSPEGPSVLVANPADKMIYLYKEGMAAPLGGFNTNGRQPRAVLVVDRGLRESRPGEYATSVPVAKAGAYDVVFFLDAPRVVACFTLDVAPKRNEPAMQVTRVAAIAPPRTVIAGQPVTLRFALTDDTGRERRRASDVRALALEAPGVWQQRGDARPRADGSYEFEFVPPSSGIYYLWVESQSLNLARNNGQFIVFEAVAKQ